MLRIKYKVKTYQEKWELIIFKMSKQKWNYYFPGFEITVSDGSGVHVLIVLPEDTDLNEIYNLVN
jgi:outer membrane lipoprotein-sorting protein